MSDGSITTPQSINSKPPTTDNVDNQVATDAPVSVCEDGAGTVSIGNVNNPNDLNDPNDPNGGMLHDDDDQSRNIKQPTQPTTDNLVGLVNRQLNMGNMTASTGTGVPEHIQKLARDNPGQVSIMEWTPTKSFKALDAKDVASYVKFIQQEFVALLHTTKNGVTDAELRLRLCKHKPIANFAHKYEKIFTSITNRDIATNPQLMTPILYQVFLLQELQAGHISEDHAKSLVASSAMEAMMKEAHRRGAITIDELRACKQPP